MFLPVGRQVYVFKKRINFNFNVNVNGNPKSSIPQSSIPNPNSLTFPTHQIIRFSIKSWIMTTNGNFKRKPQKFNNCFVFTQNYNSKFVWNFSGNYIIYQQKWGLARMVFLQHRLFLAVNKSNKTHKTRYYF